MSHLFQPTRSLLYPQFETYRLHSLDPTDDVSTCALPGSGATQSRVGYNTHLLSFKETRARIAWDHLVTEGKGGVYIDADWNVVGFELNVSDHIPPYKALNAQDDLTPTFSTLASLPQPISSSQAAQHPEYPSVLSLSPTQWLVATGSGSLYLLNTSGLSGELVARYDLYGTGGTEPLPFLLHAVHTEGDLARVLISRARRDEKKTIGFELLEVLVDLGKRNGVDDGPEAVDVQWRLPGGDVPVWCAWEGGAWVILSGEAFADPPSEAEKEDVIEMDKENDGMAEGVEEDMEVDKEDEQPAPYSWTQNSESISLTIPLPSGTTRDDVSVGLTATTFTLSVATDPSPTLAAFLAKPSRQFWTTIDPSTSTWTFGPDKIELDLVKVDENTRWPSVFFSDDDDEDEVPETLSKAMLEAVKASFANIHTRSEGEPGGNHPAIPALLREEMEYDLEDGEDYGENATGLFGEPGGRVGRDVLIGRIRGGVPTWSKAPVTVVSLPLGSRPDIMVKSAVDGLLFALPSGDPTREPWEHVATSPALSFVLSSKRDLRLVRHVGERAGTTVLAFDAGGMASGNVYVYYPPVNKTTGKQGVVQVSGGDRGALLGVGEVEVGGRRVVVALCEHKLVVLIGVV